MILFILLTLVVSQVRSRMSVISVVPVTPVKESSYSTSVVFTPTSDPSSAPTVPRTSRGEIS